MSGPDYDPFGDRISVVQEPPQSPRPPGDQAGLRSAAQKVVGVWNPIATSNVPPKLNAAIVRLEVALAAEPPGDEAGLDAPALLRNIDERIERAKAGASVGELSGPPIGEAIAWELASLHVDITEQRGRHMADDFLAAEPPVVTVDDLVLVRRYSGGVFPDGRTNHRSINFDEPPALAGDVWEPEGQAATVYANALAAKPDQEEPGLDVERLATALPVIARMPTVDGSWQEAAKLIAAEYARLANSDTGS